MLDEVENLSIDGVQDLRQVFLPRMVLARAVLAPEPDGGGTLLASNCCDLI
jgi:hypothetical protein